MRQNKISLEKCSSDSLSSNEEYANNQTYFKALDLGCAVGRAVFELTKEFDEVVGVDISQSFINVARELKEFGSVKYRMIVEGDSYEEKIASVLNKGLNLERASFRIGDICNLPLDLGKFDLVLIANVLCRVTYPKTVL